MRWVLDASVIFDFAAADLLEELFRLPLTYYALDLMTAEIQQPLR